MGELATVKIRFTEPCLGTSPRNPKTYEDHIASKITKRKGMSDEEREKIRAVEVAAAYGAIDAVEERGWTGFMRDDDGFYVYNYWVRGYLKSAFQSLQETGDFTKVPAYKTRIDRFIHVHPRKIHFLTDLEHLDVLERPLRAMTAQGPRVTVARSDYLPIGTEMEFTIERLKNKEITWDHLREAFEWGGYEGMGQWRSGGYGKFEVISFEVEGKKRAA